MSVDYRTRTEIDARYRSRRADGKAGWKDDYDEPVRRVEHVLERYRPGRGAMLEMGCGAGNVALAVAAKGLFDRVYGVDTSQDAIDWAQANARGAGLAVGFRVGNVVDLACYQDGLFDLVFDSDCLHMIIGDDRADCLASVYRVLKPGGLFCVSSQCRNPQVTARHVVSEAVYFDPESELLVRDGLPHYHLRLPDEVLAELAAAGFEVLDWSMRPKKDGDDPFVMGFMLADTAKPRT